MLDWIARAKNLGEGDVNEFEFRPGQSCVIQTVRLGRVAPDEVKVLENTIHRSEDDYRNWINQSQSWPEESTTTLVMHCRVNAENSTMTSLPYSKTTFKAACERLYQHRSVVEAIRRKSHAIFTKRDVAAWKFRPDLGPAVVYNCKSDNISPAEEDDMILSVTHFPQKSAIFAVTYGCTDHCLGEIDFWLNYAKTFAFDPLLLCMIWAELERRRLIDGVDLKANPLWDGILHMNEALNNDHKNMDSLLTKQSHDGKSDRGSVGDSSNGSDDMIKMTRVGTTQNEITKRECEAVNLWVSVSTLKNGLESFKTELKSMLECSRDSSDGEENQSPSQQQQQQQQQQRPEQVILGSIRKHAAHRIQHRLRSMIVEIEGKVRYTDSLLQGMVLATQTESNHLSRRDALTNIFIAVESKKDSSHMRYIALLGMIFLPGTFFATLFSMTFFDWTAQDNNNNNNHPVVSPYIAVYFAFTVLATAATVWRFQSWARKRDGEAVQSLTAQLESYPAIAASLLARQIVPYANNASDGINIGGVAAVAGKMQGQGQMARPREDV
ncbi:hypothetical protein F5Y10DRAFT_15485 [Nemania abortiva]|nr:hypothetical protein F5Y10DRAFT_15485 [Nemania abortiva]